MAKKVLPTHGQRGTFYRQIVALDIPTYDYGEAMTLCKQNNSDSSDLIGAKLVLSANFKSKEIVF